MRLVMNGSAQTRARVTPIGFGVEDAQILAVIRQAVEAIARMDGSAGVARTDAQFADLLSLLTYCYANGIYSSLDIEIAMREDPVLLRLVKGRPHESGAIRAFRRRHRLVVERCLARALAAGWERERTTAGAARGLPEGCAAFTTERCEWQFRTPDFTEVAADRVRKAIRSDTALLDE
jgi:hypothetical protein